MFRNIKVKHIKFTSIILVAVVFVLTGVGCKGGDKEAQEKAKNVKLTYWTVEANKSALQSIVNNYQAQHPNVSISIKVIAEDDYEQALLEAWAEDQGPDIFSINSTWLQKYLTKIEPMPASTNLPYKTIVGTVKKEEKWILQNKSTYTPQTFATTFLPQVFKDVVIANKVYGLPLSFDSLVLYYNRDIFNIYNIITPPKTWIPFTEAVKAITTLDQDDNIIQAAVGMGTANNVKYAVDIASLIMMQNGTKMTEFNSNKVTFDEPIVKSGQTVEPASQALLFYTDFANFAKEAYTWNNNMPNSEEAFINGELAMFFGYAADRAKIKARAPALNFEITPFPQIDGSPLKVSFARYWIETVSKKSANTEWAWDFLVYATSAKNVEEYLNSTQLPTAHRSLLEKQIEKYPYLRTFNEQALTAESWYRGKQVDVAYELFQDMINVVNDGQRTGLSKLLRSVVTKINQTL